MGYCYLKDSLVYFENMVISYKIMTEHIHYMAVLIDNMVVLCEPLTTLRCGAPREVAARDQWVAVHLETFFADVPYSLLVRLIAQSRRVVIEHLSLAVALGGRAHTRAVVAQVH